MRRLIRFSPTALKRSLFQEKKLLLEIGFAFDILIKAVKDGLF